MAPYYILALDGGGTKGIIQVEFLRYLEIHLDATAHNIFDLFAGTSVGGINALFIASNSARDSCAGCLHYYDAKSTRRIMNKSFWDRILPFQTKPKYDGVGKRSVLTEKLPNMSMNELTKKTIIPTYDLTRKIPYVFSSDRDDALIVDVADATSAAPTYFPAVDVLNRGIHRWYMDGGVVANNPTLIALSEAINAGINVKDIRILSIGTGSETTDIDGNKSRTWGLPRWLKNGLMNIITTAPNQMSTHIAENILGDRYLRINRPLPKRLQKIDNTDTRSIEELQDIGKQWFTQYRAEINKFFA